MKTIANQGREASISMCKDAEAEPLVASCYDPPPPPFWNTTYVFPCISWTDIFPGTFPSHFVSKPVTRMCVKTFPSAFLCHLTSLFLKIASCDDLEWAKNAKIESSMQLRSVSLFISKGENTLPCWSTSMLWWFVRAEWDLHIWAILKSHCDFEVQVTCIHIRTKCGDAPNCNWQQMEEGEK